MFTGRDGDGQSSSSNKPQELPGNYSFIQVCHAFKYNELIDIAGREVFKLSKPSNEYDCPSELAGLIMIMLTST